MFERFTDRARKVMALADQEARRLNHGDVGTEHILLGLMKEGSGIGVIALRELGIDPDKVRAEVDKYAEIGHAITRGKLQKTPWAERAIEYAIKEASDLNHNYVGTGHLLLGLLNEGRGVGSLALRKFGVTMEGARDRILSILTRENGSSEATTETPEQSRATDDALSSDAMDEAIMATRKLSEAFGGKSWAAKLPSTTSEMQAKIDGMRRVIATGSQSCLARIIENLCGEAETLRYVADKEKQRGDKLFAQVQELQKKLAATPQPAEAAKG